MSLLSTGRRTAVLAAAAVLSACAAGLDPGADSYNLAAERSRNGQLLLNIVRASLGRPLTFTALQTISGAGFSGESTLDIPIVQNHADMALSLERKFRGGDRPSFTVGVLDTQEFYRGVLAPLPLQTLDLYLKRGLSKPLLMDLFFSQIEVTAADGSDLPFKARLGNDPSDVEAFSDYQRFAARLLAAGFTTRALPGKGGPDYVLCFQPDRVIDGARNPEPSTCDALAGRGDPDSGGVFDLDFSQLSPDLCALLNRRRVRGPLLDCGRRASLTLSFALRSTYEIVLYAGAAVRQAQAGAPPLVADNARSAPLMIVQRVRTAGPLVAVRYAGQDYAIPGGSGPDMGPTLQTLQLLTELIALNRSAKDLPASSLTVVSP